jgi:ParB/RepB/Spo0J family partition protein
MRDYRPWTNLEIKFLQIGFCPQGRTQRACRVFCRRNGIKFVGKRVTDENEELINRIDKQFTSNQKGNTMAKSNQNKTATASVKDAKAAAKTTSGKPATAKPEERSYNFRVLDVKNIKADDNIREVKNIEDLLASIQEHGIVNPVTVVDEGNSNFRVIAGFRRFAAAMQLGLKKVPCHVMLKNREGVDEISLTENITRMDMTPYEECMAVKALSGKKKTPAAIAKHFGRTLRWVLVRKKLADAGDKVLKKVKDGSIELGAAAKIADLPDNVFKKELEGCYRTDKYFIEGVLDRFHKDLSKAPFEHEACLKCDKCSACQADLFENEPKAYCLDPNCWARKAKKAAEAKVKKLQEEGRNARLGKFSSYGVDYEDEADKFEIGKYDSKGQELAKEAGIQKRILVDAATLKTFEYFDKRDLPDYHEESDEERQERVKKENENRKFEDAKKDLFQENLSNAICEKIEEDKKNGKLDGLVFIMHFMQSDWLDEDEEVKKKIGIVENDDKWGVEPEDFPKDFTVTSFTKIVIENLFDIICDWSLNSLKGIYRMVMGKNEDPEKLAPTDKEIEAEIKRQDEERAKNKSEDDDDDFDGEDSDE